MKILYVIYGLNVGGAETFIYNVLSFLDTKRYHIDFAIQDRQSKNQKLIDLCYDKKSSVFYITNYKKNYFKSLNDLNRLLVTNEYDCMHYHVNSLGNVIPIIAALNNEVKIVIHSHNSANNEAGIWGKWLHLFNRMLFNHRFSARIACSVVAGKWMFGNQDYSIINNAIHIEQYQYNVHSRIFVREKLGIPSDALVIGHVGRFVAAKNHDFLINCFEKIMNQQEDVYLLLVGDGPLRNEIVNKCKSIDVIDRVIFTGNIDYINQVYSAMDCLVFPSVFEGLPFTLIEAQASGLPIIASDCITKELKITDLISYYSLHNIDEWVRAVQYIFNKKIDRLGKAEYVKNSRFDISRMISLLEVMYNKILYKEL